MVRRSRQLYADPLTDHMTGCIDHRVEGAAAFQTDYQVFIRVYRGYGVNSGNTVYVPPSECSYDFSDIRFADDTGRLLPYFLESIGTNFADFAVRCYTIPTTGLIIRVLFGGGIASGSNIGNVGCLFGDNFPGSALDTGTNWTISGGSPTVSAGVLSCPQNANIRTKSTFSTNVACRIVYSSPYDRRSIVKMSDGTYNIGWDHALGVSQYRTYIGDNGSAYAQDSLGTSYTGYHTWEFIRNSTTSGIFVIDGTVVGIKTSYVPTGSLYIQLYEVGAGTINVKSVLVRKYVNPEPSHGWWGSLEDL